MTTLRLLPDFEDALRRIPGVRAASVVTGADARPTEVHVLSDRNKPAKQVVRDIQSLAMARYDLDIDHRIVSVVQIDEEPVSPAAGSTEAATGTETGGTPAGAAAPAPPVPAADRADPQRPLIDVVTVRTAGLESQVTVTLRLGDDAFEGSASGSSAPSSRPRLVARAALDAVAELLGNPAEIEHAAVVTVGSHRVAVSVVLAQLPRVGEQVLSGSAVVRSDEADAVVRSVLDALNRRLTG